MAKPKPQKSYRQMADELNGLVEWFESDQLNLDEAVAKYEQAMQLLEQMENQLKTAENRVKIHFGNFWKADISQADAVYVFLFDRYMKQLDAKLKKEAKPGLKLASHTFKIPGKKIIRQDYGVYLYKY
jgi:exodeoxyribonuclease VII small subunit